MPAGDYIEGVAFFGLMLAGTLGGGWLLLQKRLPQLTGANRAVAFGLIATLGVLAVHLTPAILGQLSRESVLVATGIWVLLASLVRSVQVDSSPAPPPPAESRASVLLAGLGVGIIVAFVIAFLRDQAIVAPGSIDVLNFHLPGVARWIETGSIWQIDVLLPNVAPGNYPNNGDVILLAAVLPWNNDFLSHLSMYPFYGLTALATYALARELGAARTVAALAGCLLVAVPVVAVPALVHSLVDAVMLFGFSAGILFLVRHARTEETSELVLAGLALGVSLGTKWYGVSAVAIAVAVWIVSSLLDRRRPRQVALQAGALIGLIALAGGVWLLRNWIESGNPVFPVEVAPLGVTIFDAPRDIVRETFGFTIADYLGDWQVWSDHILPQLRRALAMPAMLGLAGVALVAIVAIRRRSEGLRRPGLLIALVSCAALIVLAYTITPYTAAGTEGTPVLVGGDSRYVVPAIVIAAAVCAVLPSLTRWGLVAFGVLAVIAIIDGVGLASGGNLSGARLETRMWVSGIFGVGVLYGLVRAAPRLRAQVGSRWPAVVGVMAAAVVLVGVLAGYEVQKRFNAHRYLGGDPTTDYILSEAETGRTIGIAGTWTNAGISPVLPAFGPRFGNEVRYVGEFVDEMLRAYPDRDRFAAALRRDDYDYLLVGRGDPPVPEARAERWARDVGFEPVADSPRLALLRAPGAPG